MEIEDPVEGGRDDFLVSVFVIFVANNGFM